MKSKLLTLALIAAGMLAGCKSSEIDRQNVTSFLEAVPQWAEGRETEKNLTLAFRTVIEGDEAADIRIAASTDYRLKVNGAFVGHGPCVAAHGYYRIDCYELTPYLGSGSNVVSIEVAGYNEPTYYLLSQPSFLQAEIVRDGKAIAWTGRDWQAWDLQQRVQNVPKFSYQRPQMEYWNLKPDWDSWTKDVEFSADGQVKLVQQSGGQTIARGVCYPDYTVREATLMDAGRRMYTFGKEYSGFLGLEIEVRSHTSLTVDFEELLTDGELKHRMPFRGYIAYELEPGTYTLESFEPYTMQYAQVAFEGDASVKRMYLRDYCSSEMGRAQFNCSNDSINQLFEAARNTIRQCALDVFMDCPSRERAGWLGDSFFSSRVACDFSGGTLVERNFLENFLLPDHFEYIPEGMLPMTYPSDNMEGGTYIPNYAMWCVLELEEFLQRSGDRAMVDAFRDKVYALIKFFDGFLNSDGLLEKLQSWVFIEWSAANHFVWDVNYPSNMQYAAMLDAASRMYGDPALHERAEAMRATIRSQAFDGRFFIDNATRLADGSLQLTGNHTETCQYYAFFFRTATPETYPELWKMMTTEFGPVRDKEDKHPDVPKSNALFGNYMRMELLSENDLGKQLVGEAVDFFYPMVELTGTLWENMTPEASCNHGFAAHVAHVLLRDAAGLYKVDREGKTLTLRLRDTGLDSCHAVLPVGEGDITLDWTLSDGKFDKTISLPRGWKLIEE